MMIPIRRRFLIAIIALTFGFALHACDDTNAGVVTFTDEYSLPISTVFGIPTGTVTWKTKVELIVQKTIFNVNEIGSFTILGEVTNTATGLEDSFTNVATVFGRPDDYSITNIEQAQPFNSFIQITNPKIFVGASNPWQIRANDQATSQTSNFNGTIAGVGASYSSIVQGPSVADWFEPIGESNQKVRIVNRVLSSNEHGKFTGTGASFRIDGFFQDLAPGTGTLSFNSAVNYTVYGILAPPANKDEILGRKDFNLSIELTSVPEPTSMTIFGLGTLVAIYGKRRNSKAKQNHGFSMCNTQ